MISLRYVFVGLLGLVLSLGLFMVPAQAADESPFAGAKEQACAGLEFGEGDSTACDDSSSDKIDSTVTNAINMISLVVGIVSVIMIIVGGLKYVTSQGDSVGITGAKNTIIYAVVGLIIVALAQVMVRFVINRTTSSPAEDPPGSGGNRLIRNE